VACIEASTGFAQRGGLPGDARFDGSHIVMHRHGMARKKISTTVYITPEQNERLKQLHEKTKVPVAEYIREGIDWVLEAHRDQLPGQLTLDSATARTARK
jgi:hypothetical protein